ncbi:ferric reductase [Paenibacillus aurantiacus]|uniref:Ferric reductase n=1 Tax=Paenibacillus aurantiacus TaxID=1936118 RepID=A0ABV5KNN5_9BACL
MIASFLALPWWETIRALGLLSFAAITAGICLGILYSLPFWSAPVKKRLYKTHSTLTIGGAALGMGHGILTVIDTYVPYSWSMLLLPFTASHRPVLSGLGTLSFYLLLLIILSTDLRGKLKRPLWFLLHLSAYPAFVMSLVHGFFMGTDSSSLAAQWFYALSACAVVLATLVRATYRSFTSTGKGSRGETARLGRKGSIS